MKVNQDRLPMIGTDLPNGAERFSFSFAPMKKRTYSNTCIATMKINIPKSRRRQGLLGFAPAAVVAAAVGGLAMRNEGMREKKLGFGVAAGSLVFWADDVVLVVVRSRCAFCAIVAAPTLARGPGVGVVFSIPRRTEPRFPQYTSLVDSAPATPTKLSRFNSRLRVKGSPTLLRLEAARGM